MVLRRTRDAERAFPSPGQLRAVHVTALVAAAAYLCLSLIVSRGEVLSAFRTLSVPGVTAAALLSTLNYALRYARWTRLLARLGHRLGHRDHLPVYLGGFALTILPGKVGELVRSVFLTRYGVGSHDSVAAFVAERALDLLSMLLLASPALLLYAPYRPLAAATATLALAVTLTLFTPFARRALQRLSTVVRGRPQLALRHAQEVLTRTQACLPAPDLPFLLVVSVLAWGAEGLGLWALLGTFKQSILVPAVGIYALSVIAGAVSFLPAGLGGTEAVMATLLRTQLALPLAQAAAVTVTCRVLTLWYAVVLGLIALRFLQLPDRSTLERPALSDWT